MDFQTWRIIFSDIGEPISVKKIKMILRVVPDFPIDGHIYAYMHTHINTNHTCTHTPQMGQSTFKCIFKYFKNTCNFYLGTCGKGSAGSDTSHIEI